MVFIMTIRTVLGAAAAATLVLSACGAPAAQDSDSPQVIAAFYPLEWASSQVLDGRGSVTSLTMPGSEAHDLELTPKQIASLADADLVVYLKGFQPAVDQAIEQSGAENVFDVSTVVDLQPPAEGHTHDHADDEGHSEDDGHDHGDEEGHDHSEDDGHDHDHGDFDPHFWQDPERMQTLMTALGDRLAEVDPTNKDDFTANAAAAVTELTKLDDEFKQGLAQCERSEFITTHAAFNYLAERYGLTEIGISGINPDDEPSPARVAEIHAEAKAHSVTTIFFETLTSNAVAKAIAGDLGLKTAVLDPLEGVTKNSPGQDYPSIMRANLEALRSANGCS